MTAHTPGERAARIDAHISELFDRAINTPTLTAQDCADAAAVVDLVASFAELAVQFTQWQQLLDRNRPPIPGGS
ncbi:hypothetical protein [Nocardia sp. SC052]|uniref:hypothetical protein n=1 Tax=Nocardia sichangensis TaxID=3385975 RepID=UPI0039A0F93B